MAVEPTPHVRSGSGEPVLLLHPFLLSHHVWRGVVGHLAPRHDVLAVTMPGHWGGPALTGRAASIAALADGVEASLDAHGWGTCHVAGNSLGGWVALELERRGRARSVTAIAPAGGWERLSLSKLQVGLRFLGLYPLAGLGRVVGLPVAGLAPIRHRVLALATASPAAVADEDFAALVRAATHCAAHLPVMLGNLAEGGAQGLADVKAPVQLVLVADDKIIPVARYGRKFLYELPDTASKVVLSRVGHVPMLEDPAMVAGLIADHVAAANRLRATA